MFAVTPAFCPSHRANVNANEDARACAKAHCSNANENADQNANACGSDVSNLCTSFTPVWNLGPSPKQPAHHVSPTNLV